MDLLHLISEQVLPGFAGLTGARVAPLGSGLINQTFLVERDHERFVLQRVAAIFPAAINDNIAAVTSALARAGLATPRLVPALDGRPYLDLGEERGVWRVQTFVHGVCFESMQSPAQARAAGALVARFHRTLEGLPHEFVGLRVGVHDTPKHLARLKDALAKHPRHRLLEKVRPLAETILARANDLPPLPDLPPRICHGDLKLNNILFAGDAPEASATAVCLIDLDTVGPMSLAHELGDAWRSWCNRSGEDTEKARIDLDLLRASFDGYAGGIGRTFTEPERRALLGGVEWISLELASRFAADALFENYFGWNAQRHGSRGEHNLVRAQGQFALHETFLETRKERAVILNITV
jgi:Ser/Thr protein kinase RdoA (MazF antagonist)